MNLANPETKVGIFTVVSLVGILSLYMWLNGTQLFEKGSQVEAVFERVEGLRPGAAVKFIGVDVGRVSKVYFDDFKVIVVMRINPDFKIPRATKALINSAGFIGDKYVELSPLKPGEKMAPGNRIAGQTPITMEQFYSSAYEVLNSLKRISSDIKGFTGQLDQIDLVKLVARIDNTATIIERMAQTNEIQVHELVDNITRASAQLAEASTTANRFLKEVGGDEQTAADLKQMVANARNITDNLDKFTDLLAEKGPQFEQLIDDAHETMQSINQAAQKVDQAIDQITSGDGDLSKVKETLDQAGDAAIKVGDYVKAFEKVKIKNGLGAGYRSDNRVTVDYRMDLSFNDNNSLLLGLEDIGKDNGAILQWGLKATNLTGRVGLYKSKFGLGVDYPTSSNFTFGVDIWDTYSTNLGVSSTWKFTKDWSMLLGGSTNLKTNDLVWNVECWRGF
jgi:phospholipid/cholesterol/gamma-HCH transport system substrate-binding protein